MELESQLLHQINDSSLNCSERALLRCEYAKRLEEAGNYEAARAALGNLWQQIGERPDMTGLDELAAAELLLRVGVLTGWIGSTCQLADAQEQAKNLISESMTMFEAMRDMEKVAEAIIELAVIYWREGATDEARVMFRDAIDRLADTESELKTVALVRSAVVEHVAARHHDALRILTEAAPLVQQSGSQTLKGKFHNELATVLKNLGTAEGREDYIDRALIEYAAASFHFEQAGHVRYRACVENNLGFLYSMIGKPAEAHEHLSCARRLFVNLKDEVHAAQVDETRARVMLAEGRIKEAEKVARAAVEVLERGGEHQLLAEALTTHGTALARLGQHQQAKLTLQHASAVAEQAGDLEGAGHAMLAAIEEVGELFSAHDLSEMYERAAELLAKSQYPATRKRLTEAAQRVLRLIKAELRPPVAAERTGEFRPLSSWHKFHLWTEIRRYEAYWIERALKEAGGIVTRAAQLLGFKHHQSLNALLKGRHSDLLRLRRPIEPRKRSIFRVRDPRRTSKCRAGKAARPVTILHAEDNSLIAGTVRDTLALEGWHVDTCAEGASALKKLESGVIYDLLLFDNELPGVSGLDLIKCARQLVHHRQTPIIMLSASDCRAAALRAGAHAFLRKPEDMRRLAETIARLLDIGAENAS